MEETKWGLCLCRTFFDGDNFEDGFIISLSRLPDRNGPSSISIDCECALLTADGCVAEQLNLEEEEFTEQHSVLLKFSDLKYGISAVFLNGNLTVRCKMWKCFRDINKDGYCTARTHIGVGKNPPFGLSGISAL
ncbi:hypothetical protein CDAR_538051 [Caerostris darwini]|uniref:Uncharacterized protein n=1 Tax=Caerostris darwini TaxID=1538125 RepID=A0AAV4TG96_9ARAC|nr:hypothetical protein CDAR_538051 [Caerostris darwini]